MMKFSSFCIMSSILLMMSFVTVRQTSALYVKRDEPGWAVVVTPLNCSIYGVFSSEFVEEGDWIATFTPDTVCAGMSAIQEEGIYFLTAYGAVDTLVGFEEGDQIEFRWYDTSESTERILVVASGSDEPIWSNFATLHIDLELGNGTSVGDNVKTAVPIKFVLHQNQPNPFNPTTVIQYDLAVDSWVLLKIYDSTGQLVKTIINKRKEAGYQTAIWNGTNESGKVVNSGIYFYHIEVGNFSQTQRCVLLK